MKVGAKRAQHRPDVPMKKSLGTALTELLRKKRAAIAIGSVCVMVMAAFSTTFCEGEILALEKKWRSLYGLKELWGSEGRKATAGTQSRDLTRYDIQLSLKRSAGDRVEIQFCDKYSFIVFEGRSPSGVYCKAEQGSGKYVSSVDYPQVSKHGKMPQDQLKDIHLRFKSDLVEQTVLIYADGKFMEKIRIDSGPVNYSVGLAMQPRRKGLMLKKLEVFDREGKALVHVDFVPLLFYAFVSRVFFLIGALIFLALACSEKILVKKALLFIFLLFSFEAFLRMSYSHDPDLAIDQLKPKWQFGISTNFYGVFNDSKELTIRSYFGGKNTYSIMNPEHARRIVLLGSSPLAGGDLSARQHFPAILEGLLNSASDERNSVIPIIVPKIETFNGPEPNVFLKEVLRRLTPDLIIYYGKLAPMERGHFRAQFESESALYHRAKKIMEENSDWIKNDRLLYAALEFKKPIKEIVRLYDFLCNSYLFMAAENIRKRVLGRWFLIGQGISSGNPESFFEEVLTLCKAKKIKVVFIPQLDFSTYSNDFLTKEPLANFLKEHPEVHCLSLEGVFRGDKNYLLAEDRSHPTEYGHQVMAEEIFRQLMEKGLLDIQKAIK